MYIVTDKNSFYDMQDETKHTYNLNDAFPFDNREISESRLIELSSDLNRKRYPLIELVSDLKGKSKKEIQGLFEEREISYDKSLSKEKLINEYEYQKSRERLIQELESLNLQFDENLSNYEITKFILESNRESK